MCRYAIVDLEMCKVPKRARNEKYHFANEIIQIGAVLINENLEVQGEYNTFVHPEFGSIDKYIRNLTGITDEDLIDAPSLDSALKNFIAWVPDNTKVVSWSDSDKLQISHEIEAKELSIIGIDNILNNWIDCQKTFSEKMHCDKCYNLTEALVLTDINYKDGAHNGLVDAYNTALLFIKMQKEKELVLSKYYQSAISEEVNHCGFNLGSLLGDINLEGLASA